MARGEEPLKDRAADVVVPEHVLPCVVHLLRRRRASDAPPRVFRHTAHQRHSPASAFHFSALFGYGITQERAVLKDARGTP